MVSTALSQHSGFLILHMKEPYKYCQKLWEGKNLSLLHPNLCQALQQELGI